MRLRALGLKRTVNLPLSMKDIYIQSKDLQADYSFSILRKPLLYIKA